MSNRYYYLLAGKTNQMHQLLNFILFWNNTLHVSDDLSVHHKEFKTVHTATGICQTGTATCLLVKPTRCTSFSILFYFGITIYMFWTIFPSIIRSSRLYIQQQVYVKQVLLLLQAGSSTCLTYTCCCMYSLELLMMDGKTVRNM